MPKKRKDSVARFSASIDSELMHQHDHGEHIISTLHCHLDHHNCIEIIAVRGRASAIKKLSDNLIGAKGVKHGKVALTAIGHKQPS